MRMGAGWSWREPGGLIIFHTSKREELGTRRGGTPSREVVVGVK